MRPYALLFLIAAGCGGEQLSEGQPPLLEYEVRDVHGVTIRHVRGYPIQTASITFTTATRQPAAGCRLVEGSGARIEFQEDYLLVTVAPFARNSTVQIDCPENIALRQTRSSLSDGSVVEAEHSSELNSAGFNNPVTLWGTFLGGMAGLILLSILLSVILEALMIRVTNED